MGASFSLQLLRKEQVSQHAWSFYFSRDESFTFLPGQYNRLTLPIEQPDDRGTSRFFTIASSPTEKEYLMLTTEEGPSAFKQKLFSLQPGESIQAFGPMGKFIFDPTDTRPHIFLAGGIGITPYHSMVKYAFDTQTTIPMTLFVSWKTAGDMVYDEQLRNIKQKSNWFNYVPTMTRLEENDTTWQGEKGRISAEIIMKYAPDFLTSVFFITGPVPMVEAMEQLVKEMGVPQEQIRVEKFTGY